MSNELLNLMLQIGREKGVAEVRRVFRQFEKEIRRGGRTVQKRKTIPKKWVLAALARQNYKCQRCMEPLAPEEATGDHFIALDNGGEHSPKNLVALHQGCNSSKGNRPVYEDAKRLKKTVKDRLRRENL